MPSELTINKEQTLSILHPALASSMLSGQITARVAKLISSAVTSLNFDGKYSLKEIKEMFKICPVSNASIQLKALRGANTVGKYSNSDKYLQEWVRDNLDNMEGSFHNVCKKLIAGCFGLGSSLGEIVLSPNIPGYYGQWRLKTIPVIDLERIRYEGKCGDITHLVYRHDQERILPYKKVIHITNSIFDDSPWGWAEGARAIPFYKARALLLSEWLVAAKNQATPILVGRAESNNSVRILGANGKPMLNPDGTDRVVSGPEALMYNMQSIESSGIIVTDKNNEITSIPQSAGSLEFQTALQMMEKMIYLCYSIPALAFSEGSAAFGNAGLSTNQTTLLDSMLDSIVEDLRDNLIEKLIKPLIYLNFGRQKDYGKFEQDKTPDPQTASLKVTNLISAISIGALSASDPDIINVLRSLLGIPELDEEVIKTMAEAQKLEQQMQQQAVVDPAAAGFSSYWN